MSNLYKILLDQYRCGEITLADLEEMNDGCDGMMPAEVAALGKVLDIVWAEQKEKVA